MTIETVTTETPVAINILSTAWQRNFGVIGVVSAGIAGEGPGVVTDC